MGEGGNEFIPELDLMFTEEHFCYKEQKAFGQLRILFEVLIMSLCTIHYHTELLLLFYIQFPVF